MRKVLASVRAGLLTKQGDQMVADPRKGVLYVREDSQFRYFEFGIRSGKEPVIEGDPEVSFIIFPEEATFRKMNQPGVRAFELVFADTTRDPLFFWSQEPKPESDDACVALVHSTINAPLEDEDDSMEEAAVTAAVPPPSTAATAGGSGGNNAPLIDPNFFSRLMQQLAQGGGAQGGMGGARIVAKSGPGLKDIFKSDVLKQQIFSDPAIQQRLMQHLPEEHRSVQQLMELALSPQFHVQMQNLSSALEAGDIDAQSFGVQASGPGVKAFLEAIQREAEAKQQQNQGGGAS